eukprot:TRINITY_DN12046_c0_g1_i1.p1 TRINITY_DN12046_c0_g1~~TRINITY_DN12046_c0_g1_i1.p1  ORF type:complete len:141 (-),score=34.81 TRINITY_DN12046_c0_g1_i1:131-553(-)
MPQFFSNLRGHFLNKLNKSILCGKVAKVIHDKTAVVVVARQIRFKNVGRYHDRQLIFKKFMIHDEKNEVDVGDEVLIKKSRPHSKMKHWEFYKFAFKHPGNAYGRMHPEFKLSRDEIKKADKAEQVRQSEFAKEKSAKSK